MIPKILKTNKTKILLLRVFVLPLVSALAVALPLFVNALFFLPLVSMVPLLFVYLRPSSYKEVFFSTLVFCLVYWFSLLDWLTAFHWSVYPLVVMIMTFYYLVTALVTSFLLKNFPRWDILIIAACFTLMEHFRTLGFLKFTYGNIAYSLQAFTTFLQAADIAGDLGLTFILFLINAMVAKSIWVFFCKKGKETPPQNEKSPKATKPWVGWLRSPYLLGAAGITSIILIYGFVRMKTLEVKKDTFRASLVQQWYDYNNPYTREGMETLRDRLLSLTEKAASFKPDLIVWPETAWPRYFQAGVEAGDPLDLSLLSTIQGYNVKYQTNSYFLLGVDSLQYRGRYNKELVDDAYRNAIVERKPYKALKTLYKEEDAYSFNTALLLDKGGRFTPYFTHKKLLVPVAEWFPYADLFPSIYHFISGMGGSGYTPGTTYDILKFNGLRFATLICFEDVFADFVREYALLGVDFLVLTANDAWSYKKKAALIHEKSSILRAVEVRRPILRATNSGVTSYIDVYGKVVATLPQFTADVLNVSVTTSSSKGLFYRIGYGYIPILYAWMGILFIIAVVRKFFTP